MAIFKSKPRVEPSRVNRLPIFLGLGMAAGLGLTAFVSYKLGDAALEGVTQPEGSPLTAIVSKSEEQSSTGEVASAAEFTPLNIEKVAKDTRAYIKRQTTLSKDGKNVSNVDPEKDGDQAEAENDAEKKP